MRSSHRFPAHRGHRAAGGFLVPDNCPCGARVADRDTACRKCHARARWTRRTQHARRSTALLLAATALLEVNGR